MTTKKISAIILSIVMIFSIMSVAVSAAEIEIEPYTPVSVTASLSNNPVFKFVPTETKTYIVTSYAPDDVDPFASIDTVYESYMFDDSYDSANFAEKYVFEAGVEYYITVYTYSEEDVTFDIVLECFHEWEDETCVNCDKVCDHDAENTRFKTCECGKVSLTDIIELGDTVTATVDGLAPVVFKFVPEEDVAAILYSDLFINEIMYDAQASIYDANGDEVAYNDDFGGSMNFVLWYEFTAGETYYFEINSFYEDLIFDVSFVKAAHTVDGEEHAIVYTDYQSGTCQEFCYTDGLYCAECDEYFAGHLEDGYGFCWDDDWDGICDVCGESMDEGDDEDIEPENTSLIGMILGIINYFRNLILKVFAFFISYI